MTKPILKIACHHCQQKFDVSMLEEFSRFNCPVCQVELIVPKMFGDYILEEHWGAGGMADVYRAIDPKLDREVAIKILKHEFTESAIQRKILMQEAKTAARINHINVVPIYSLGEQDERLYIVMQFMSGNSLAQVVRKHLIKPSVMLDYLIQAARGLKFAYENNAVIHHDVKPDNILLDADGHAKVGDFGIAQMQDEITKDKNVMSTTRNWGSAEYASPERLKGKKIDFRSDIYSLGISVHELLTGIKAQAVRKPGPLDRTCRSLPRKLINLLKAMLNDNPAKRPGYDNIIRILGESLRDIEKDL